VRAQNETLRQQLAELEVRLQEQRALAARAGKLQELMDLKQGASVPTIAAEVIAGSPIPDMLTITINRGSADGVQPDMAVISPKGIVGRVLSPLASHAARVQLIIDRDAAVGALTERSRSGGVVLGVQGQAGSPLRMDLVSNHADVQANDVVVASGVDGIYPKGFVIGTVERSDRGEGLHREITLRPAVDFSSIEEVLVVLVPAKGATREDPAAPRDGGDAREVKK